MREPRGVPQNGFQIEDIHLQPHEFDRSQMHEKQFSNRRYCKDHPNVEGVTVGLLVF